MPRHFCFDQCTWVLPLPLLCSPNVLHRHGSLDISLRLDVEFKKWTKSKTKPLVLAVCLKCHHDREPGFKCKENKKGGVCHDQFWGVCPEHKCWKCQELLHPHFARNHVPVPGDDRQKGLHPDLWNAFPLCGACSDKNGNKVVDLCDVLDKEDCTPDMVVKVDLMKEVENSDKLPPPRSFPPDKCLGLESDIVHLFRHGDPLPSRLLTHPVELDEFLHVPAAKVKKHLHFFTSARARKNGMLNLHDLNTIGVRWWKVAE